MWILSPSSFKANEIGEQTATDITTNQYTEIVPQLIDDSKKS